MPPELLSKRCSLSCAKPAGPATSRTAEYLEGRTTDRETWLRTPENLERFAAFTREANARRRAIEEREIPAAAADPSGPVDQRRQEHEQQHQQPGQHQGLQP
ncbi:hypothetical protein ACH4PX_05150 [Streptomyces anulatus]